jgi:hypothetical protein
VHRLCAAGCSYESQLFDVNKKLYFGLIGILAVTIVLVIQVVGLILVIALLTIPPFIVEKYAFFFSDLFARDAACEGRVDG